MNFILLNTAQGGMGSILMIVALFVVFYFFMIRPQQKQQKKLKAMREALKKGDKVAVSYTHLTLPTISTELCAKCAKQA